MEWKWRWRHSFPLRKRLCNQLAFASWIATIFYSNKTLSVSAVFGRFMFFFLFSLNSNSNSPHLKLTFYLILYKGHSTRSLFILIIGNWKYRNLALQLRNYKFSMSIFLKRWSIFWFSNFLIGNLLRDLPWGENKKSWCINMYGFSHTLIINWACSKANFVAKLI